MVKTVLLVGKLNIFSEQVEFFAFCLLYYFPLFIYDFMFLFDMATKS